MATLGMLLAIAAGSYPIDTVTAGSPVRMQPVRYNQNDIVSREAEGALMDSNLFENLNLSEETMAKAMAATTSEELLAIVRDEGIELTDEQLKAVAGGLDWDTMPPGDTRDDIDEAFVSEAFRTGRDLGDGVE